MEKTKVKHLILEELSKEDWDSDSISDLIRLFKTSRTRKAIMSKVSDALPKIAAEVCGVTVDRMMLGERKREVILALKFVYKDLHERHGYHYQKIADRFGRKEHGTIMSAISSLNDLLETNPETIEKYKIFRAGADNLKKSLTK